MNTLADFGSLNPPSRIPVGLAATSKLSPFRTIPGPESEHQHLIRPCHICYTEAGSLDRATTAARRRSASILTMIAGHQASDLRLWVKRVAYAAQHASSESTSTVAAVEANLRLCTPLLRFKLHQTLCASHAPHANDNHPPLRSQHAEPTTKPSRQFLSLPTPRELDSTNYPSTVCIRLAPSQPSTPRVRSTVYACLQPIFGSCRCHDATEAT